MQATVRRVNVSSLHGVFGFLTSCGVHGRNNLGTPTRGNKELDCVALRCTTNPLSVPLPRSITKSSLDQAQDGTRLPTLRFSSVSRPNRSPPFKIICSRTLVAVPRCCLLGRA
ncbi:hypothetical protein P691DRAFT_574389 [Macrolepiota fuliginosa MF-IS2]|uniref:Uncharacterized protein n=1 Tax=Macrolepiota fuliginosa MF-IS2 TaxID=1400762 RepID=A0A9P5X200_9AGAR|nr:hypothetical protein P691DRAFT_574389 [Macrolepiota fuliginosa MF-IS2]